MAAHSPPDTYWGLVEAAARHHPDRVLLADDHGRSLTACQLRTAALSTAAAFQRRGITAGTVVSWQLPTTLETMVVMAALCRVGAVQNPLLPVWRESELRFATAQLGTQVIIAAGQWRGFDHAAMVREVAEGTDMDLLVIDHGRIADGELCLPADDPASLTAPPGDGALPRWVYYSSGTTAAPKGVRHNDRSVIAGSAGVVEMIGAASDDVYPIAFPISHIGGAAMLAASLRTGMRLVLFDHFDSAATPFAMAAHHPTILGTATPFFVAFMAAQREHGEAPLFPQLRACVGGGAPITPELGRRVRENLTVPGVANSWGLTEFPVATSPAFDAAAPVLDHTVGRPVSGVSVRVCDGELRLKGPQCFLGYVDQRLDADAFDADGWFRSGDCGHVDADGNVVVTGRIKDVIIRNAENISADEVEGVLATHPAIDDVAVIGVPDPRTGERVCAVVVSEVPVSLESVVAHCRSRGLSPYKFPERIELVSTLPRNPTGKVLKAQLRSRYA